MNSNKLSDATARALDLLPPDDPSISDPRMARDPALLEEARLSRETAAAVWLAVSPLRVSPPDVLQDVLREIQQPGVAEAEPNFFERSLPWLAASGWAAAAAIAFLLWPKNSPSTANREFVAAPTTVPAEKSEEPERLAPSPSRDSQARKDVARLQDRLTKMLDESRHRTPRVMSLSAPGAVRRTQEETQQQVQKILTSALRSALEISGGAASGPGSLVIERGWLPGALPMTDDGGIVRHRNFPEEDWQKLGFSKSPDGSYYDDASQSVWSPDPEGRGFIGRKISPEDDVTSFTKEPDEAPIAPKQPAKPEGFIIENPTEKTVEMIVQNMPEISEGEQLVLQTTSTDGTITEVSLTSTPTTEVPLANAPVSEVPLTNAPRTDAPATLPATPEIGTSSSPITFGPIAISSATIGSGLRLIAGNPIVYSTNSPMGVLSANTTSYSNIVGYLNNGEMIVSFPSGTMPTAVQLRIDSTAPASQPGTVIVEGGP